MYLTTCLLKILTLATSTFEEQQKHIVILQSFSERLLPSRSTLPISRNVSHEYVNQSLILGDDGVLPMGGSDEEDGTAGLDIFEDGSESSGDGSGPDSDRESE